MSDRVLVTGGAGFIGSHVCERLVAVGHQVWLVDSFDGQHSADQKRRNVASLVGSPSVQLVEGDVRDSVLLSGLLSDVPFAAVIHLACRSNLAARVNGPETCEVGIRGTLRLLEAMKRHSVPRLVLGSSTSVYGERGGEPCSEADPAGRPTDPEGACSRASELLAHTYHANHGLSVHCLRLSAVYGPRQWSDQVPHRYASLLDDPGISPRDHRASVRRDYIYVGDVADAVSMSLESLCEQEEPVYEILNISGPDCVPEPELLSRLAAALGIEPYRDPGRTAEDDGEITTARASGEKARSLLGFEPKIGLDEGLAHFARWYRNGNTAPVTGPGPEPSDPPSHRS